jgi:hypothetical protein
MMGVDFPREVDCMRCGAPTMGRATCELCFEAITELRALAHDQDAPYMPSYRQSPRSQSRRNAGRNASVDAGE